MPEGLLQAHQAPSGETARQVEKGEEGEKQGQEEGQEEEGVGQGPEGP